MDAEEAAVKESQEPVAPESFPQPVYFIVCSFMCPATLRLC